MKGRPTNSDNSRAWAYCACNRCGCGCFGLFPLSLSLSLSGRLLDILSQRAVKLKLIKRQQLIQCQPLFVISFSGIEQKFALFLTTDGQIPLNTSSTIMTRTIYETTVCLKFWYLMPNQNSELKVYVTEGVKPPQLVWETHHQLTSQWKMVEIPIQVNSPFLVSTCAFLIFLSETFKVSDRKIRKAHAISLKRNTLDWILSLAGETFLIFLGIYSSKI